MSRLSSSAGVMPTRAAPMFSSRRSSFVVPGIGTIHGFWARSQAIAVPVTGPLRMAVVGTPAYFAAHRPPRTPRDLGVHRCINFRLPTAGTIYKWEFEQGRRKVEVGVDGPLIFDDEQSVLDCASAGLGLAYLVEDQVSSMLKAGALTRVLEDWCPPFPGFFLYYPGRRQVSPALAAFIDAVRVSGGTRKGPSTASA